MKLAGPVFFDEKQDHLNIWWQGIALLSILLLLNLPLYLFDHRLLADEVLWVKPLKFEISAMIHLMTLAVLASLLNSQQRNGRLWKGMAYVVVAATLFEVLYIFLQAARGRESHYNNSTPIESLMYGLMGLGAVLMVLGSFYLGWLVYQEYKRTHKSERNSTLLLSVALGLTLGSLLTLIIAGFLSSQPDNDMSAVSQEAWRVPLFGWYLNGQDFRIPHFLATHMMQLIPLYGWWLSRGNVATEECKARLCWVTGIYTLIVAALFLLGLMKIGLMIL